MLENGAAEHWDNEQKMAYTAVGDQWYGFGNPRSMKEKVRFSLKMSSKCIQKVMYFNTIWINVVVYFHCKHFPVFVHN